MIYPIVEWFCLILPLFSAYFKMSRAMLRISALAHLAHRVTSWYPVGKSVVLFLSSSPNGFSTSD
jgi:hypothetical protein